MSTDLLSLVYQYRSLIGRREILGRPLSDDEEGRVLALESLFGWSSGGPGQERRRMARCPVAIPALAASRGRIAAVTIVDVSGDGLSLDRAPEVTPGDGIVVVVQHLQAGLEYRLPAAVCWRRDDRATLGARWDGVPVLIRHRRGVTAGAPAA